MQTFEIPIFSCIQVYFNCEIQFLYLRMVQFCFRYTSHIFSIIVWTQGKYDKPHFSLLEKVPCCSLHQCPYLHSKHWIPFEKPSSNKPGYRLRDFSLTKIYNSSKTEIQKDEFEKEIEQPEVTV